MAMALTTPTGFMAANKVAEASWEWGKLATIALGCLRGPFLPAIPGDVLVDLIYTLKAAVSPECPVRDESQHTGSGSQSSRTVTATISGSRQRLLVPRRLCSISRSRKPKTCPISPPMAYAIAFGDFKRGYLIVDRLGLRILRDPYSAKPYVLFYTNQTCRWRRSGL